MFDAKVPHLHLHHYCHSCMTSAATFSRPFYNNTAHILPRLHHEVRVPAVCWVRQGVVLLQWSLSPRQLCAQVSHQASCCCSAGVAKLMLASSWRTLRRQTLTRRTSAPFFAHWYSRQARCVPFYALLTLRPTLLFVHWQGIMNFNPSLKTYVHLLDVKHKRLVSKAQVAGVSSCTASWFGFVPRCYASDD